MTEPSTRLDTRGVYMSTSNWGSTSEEHLAPFATSKRQPSKRANDPENRRRERKGLGRAVASAELAEDESIAPEEAVAATRRVVGEVDQQTESREPSKGQECVGRPCRV
jgi:hypothetical protein